MAWESRSHAGGWCLRKVLRFQNMKSIWMIRAGEGGYLSEEFAKGYVAIGWWDLGDLSGKDDPEKIKLLYLEAYPKEKPGKIANAVAMIHKFCNVIQKDDTVITYDRNSREYRVGDVVSDYFYKENVVTDSPHLRKVNWKSKVSRDVLNADTRNSLGSTLTLFSVNPEAWKDIELAMATGKSSPKKTEAELSATDYEQIKKNTVQEAHELIKDKLLELDEYEMQDLVAALLRAMGYRTSVSPRGPDRGRDVFASPDGLGFQEPRIKAEVKHRQNTAISAKDIRSFLGGLRPGDKALYVSTGGFTKDANYEADRSNIPLALVDLDKLATLIETHYEQFDSNGRILLPLSRIYWPSE